MNVTRLDHEWLDTVAEIAEADLPCNSTTVAYAIRIAVAMREERNRWMELFDEICESTSGPGKEAAA